MQPENTYLNARSEELCRRIGEFMQRAASEERAIYFSHTGNHWFRVGNVKCVIERKGKDPKVNVSFDYYKWFFGYQLERSETIPFFPCVKEVVEYQSDTLLRVDAHCMFESVKPWRLFNKNLW